MGKVKKTKAKLSKKSAAKTEDGLNFQQNLFCEYYVSQDIELFGNGTKSYIEAYNPKRIGSWYEVAMANASRLLRSAKIIKRINELLSTGGFSDENVDKQHLFLINQHADLRTKMQAIKEFNVLKKRITNKLDLTSGGKPIPLFDNVSNNNSNKKDKGVK